MPTKQEVITELATQTAQRITRSGEDYMAFLTTAANNFKYSFQDQLLIFAQSRKRPPVLKLNSGTDMAAGSTRARPELRCCGTPTRRTSCGMSLI